MLVRMRDGSSAPDEQAEPWLAAIPAKSIAMRSSSPCTPGKERLQVLQMRCPMPLTITGLAG